MGMTNEGTIYIPCHKVLKTMVGLLRRNLLFESSKEIHLQEFVSSTFYSFHHLNSP